MKKVVSMLFIFSFLCIVNASFAAEFDALENLTPAQKQKLTQLQYNFKQDNDSLEMRIMEYNNKIAKVKSDATKTKEQVSLLTSAYERNISTLKTQQKLLKQKTETSYRAVMTDDQYAQYKAQQMNVEEAFKNFLQK